MDDPDSWVDRAAAAYAAGRPLALLFDFDGTLTPIVSHPRLAELSVGMRALLTDLALTGGVTVGVLSGRPLADVKGKVGLTCILYAGSGGMHVDLGHGVLTDAAAVRFDRAADAITTLIASWVARFPKAWIEHKPGCLAVHYRELTTHHAETLCRLIRKAIARAPAGTPPLRTRRVTRTLEIRPANAWTKGDAVDRMLSAGGAGVFPIYAGDGANDEEAVERVNAHGGLTIGVGREAPAAATIHLATPEGLVGGLAGLCSKLKRLTRAGNAV
jgi:trehalose 6-phosphate phosphatase